MNDLIEEINALQIEVENLESLVVHANNMMNNCKKINSGPYTLHQIEIKRILEVALADLNYAKKKLEKKKKLKLLQKAKEDLEDKKQQSQPTL